MLGVGAGLAGAFAPNSDQRLAVHWGGILFVRAGERGYSQEAAVVGRTSTRPAIAAQAITPSPVMMMPRMTVSIMSLSAGMPEGVQQPHHPGVAAPGAATEPVHARKDDPAEKGPAVAFSASRRAPGARPADLLPPFGPLAARDTPRYSKGARRDSHSRTSHPRGGGNAKLQIILWQWPAQNLPGEPRGGGGHPTRFFWVFFLGN